MRVAVPLAGRVLRPFQRFVSTESAGGLVLLGCTVVALVWANSPWADGYVHLWERPLTVGGRAAGLTLSLHAWINDALMAIFFFLVGLEIKRELLVGELASPRQAALPIAGAIGGMLVPAAIFAAVNRGGPGAAGWGIPMATDIAFALGALSLLGPGVPTSLRVFLTALAIVDDIGAVLVIAVFYTAQLALVPIAVAAALVALLLGFNRAGVRHAAPYAIVGVVLWLAVFASGIHATIAGVLLAMTIPARSDAGGDASLLVRLEQRLHGVSAFVVMPLFALSNAGVRIGADLAAALSWPVASGVVLGLALGKPVGITLVSWIAIRLRVAALPPGVSWRALHGVTWLGGIGFTMSLFVAGLAYGRGPLLDSAKIGILAASLIAGLAGWVLVRRATRAPVPV
ncbi:MAG: Na+/H+ antiporter NhaA [Gemmatimonadales bacterium]|nr:Na+/H+ antiporter NhaA [Gemmatimonadales bacterium]